MPILGGPALGLAGAIIAYAIVKTFLASAGLPLDGFDGPVMGMMGLGFVIPFAWALSRTRHHNRIYQLEISLLTDSARTDAVAKSDKQIIC